ncbi:phasin family protein [Ferribacterium limneticum]|uniref:phasin family protein n=1 Tax=Ferribacterium limneticum TaxID=76259 RepID=UPI001CFBCE92|nr:phasin family protein [Ferribacterium limneticum]UCV29422.1 TIGR01841 family phasin [Ferribacterium limneticum]UCV33341.1 TIGR01841 family phasin [Ferribacterium limneticum]
MMNAEKVIAAHKAQLSALHEMSSKALETIEKLAHLNLETSKNSLERHHEHAHSLLSSKDIKELSKLHNNALQDLAEKAAAYNHNLFGIAIGLGNEFSELVEARMADAQQQFVAAVEATMKNVPQGAEPVVEAVRNALTTANEAMDSLQNVVKQATESTQSKLAALSESTVKASKVTKAKAVKAVEKAA